MDNLHYYKGSTFDDIYRDLLWRLSYRPQHLCSPRGSKVKERLAVTLELTDPRARLLSCTKRNTNYGFAVGEFLWYWCGKRDLETMLYYNKRMKDYSDDGKTLNSAYGWRLRRVLPSRIAPATMNQWEVARRTLIGDPDSRRCVLHVNDPHDQYEAVTNGSKDVPCTLSLQFFIRENRLDLHVHMRSNDVMWGLTYDLFSFTLFQECMLLDLRDEVKFKDLKLGKYYHTAGSMHLYEPHFEQAEDIVREYGRSIEYKKPMEPLRSLWDLDEVANIEEALRKGSKALSLPGDFQSPTAEWMVTQLREHREKRDREAGGR